MMQIVSDDAVARQRRVCKFVAGRIPWMHNGAQTNGAQTPPRLRSAGHARPIRWLTKLRAARSRGPGIRY